MTKKFRKGHLAWVFLLALVSCNHHHPSPNPSPGPNPTVGGSVTGLVGTLVLQNDGGDNLSISGNGFFVFATPVSGGSTYNITVLTQPSSQTCTVTNGSGTIGSSNVTNVAVSCSTNPTTVGGNVTGLVGTLVLQNDGGDNLSISGNGSFVFATPISAGSTYNITVLTQPPSQACTVTNGSGTMGSSNVTNVAVSCSTNPTTVGGNVAGLVGTLVLQNNGGDNLSVSGNGPFVFVTPISAGSTYNITVLTQPLNQTCTVTNGSGTMGSSNVTNVAVSCSTNPTTLASSLSSLALSVNATGLNAALTGNPRQITITNTGAADALNVSYSASTPPSGTSIAPASCGTIAAGGGICILTITPGASPSAAPGDTNPTPITLTVSGDNTNSLSLTLNILTYGSVYEGGYLFSVDDSYSDYPQSGSIGGTVAALSDQSSSITWTPTMAPLPPLGNTNIWGIADTSTTTSPVPNGSSTSPANQYSGQENCNGNIDGACDTSNVYVYYENDSPSAPVPITDYAAGLCKQTINGYSDWYLPSICELGYSSNFAASACGTQGAPTRQNMQSGLVDTSVSGIGLSNVSGYWSATEVTTGSLNAVWAETFVTVEDSQQAGATKRQTTSASNVRCVRALAP